MSEWRTIDSAPKDGTVIDLWIEGPHSMVDFYAVTAKKVKGKPLRHGRATDYRWMQKPNNPPGWYPVGGLGYALSPEVTATHWSMPLPAPPTD